MYFKVLSLFFIFLSKCTAQKTSGEGAVVLKPTVCSQPANKFDMWADVDTIHGILYDNDRCNYRKPEKLKWIVTQRNTTQRLMIQQAYDIKHSDHKLQNTLKNELGGYCKTIMCDSFLTHEEIRGTELINSFQSGYTLFTILDILCTLTKDQYAALDKYIVSQLNITLYTYISQNVLTGDIPKKIVNYCLLQYTGFPQWAQNHEWCKQNLNAAINTFNKKDLDKQTLEDTLDSVLKSCSKEELAAIIAKTDLRSKIQILGTELASKREEKLFFEIIVNSTANMIEYLAYGYHMAIAEHVEHSFIIRNTIIHSNIDLQNIKESYATLFKGEKIIDHLLQSDEIKSSPCYSQTLEEYFKEPDHTIQPCHAETDPLLSIPVVTPPPSNGH